MEGEPRRVCYDCFRPEALCYCDALPRLANRTRIIVVQHPRERFHPLGTARIVQRALSNVQVVCGARRLEEQRGFVGFPATTGLLYPSRSARNLALTPAAERPESLVVLDGTWHHARTLFRDQPLLQQLPQFYFLPKAPTEYRVRREPRSDYVSTVEAVVTALELLEPGNSYSGLLDPFRRMIDLHISATQRAERRPRHRLQRPSQVRSLPKALVEHLERAVLVYGESLPSSEGTRTLCYWTAKRLASDEFFAEIVALERAPSATHLQHMGLSAAHWRHAVQLAEVRRRWRSFLRARDIVIAWNDKTLALIRDLDTPVAQSLSLKAAYRRFRAAQARGGPLEAVVDGEALKVSAFPLAGRAGLRLAQAQAVAWHLHRFACQA